MVFVKLPSVSNIIFKNFLLLFHIFCYYLVKITKYCKIILEFFCSFVWGCDNLLFLQVAVKDSLFLAETILVFRGNFELCFCLADLELKGKWL